jgi:hypothetical protein
VEIDMRSIGITALFLILALAWMPAEAAGKRTARVAGGGEVELAASKQTAAQWSARRPQFRDLRPKTRSNLE